MANKKNEESGTTSPALLPGGVTQAQVDSWKQEYDEVFQVDASYKGKSGSCYLKPPDRKTLQAAMAVSSSDPIKMNEILLQNCWLGGDKEIQTNDKLFLAAGSQLGELFELGQAQIKKL